MSSTSRPRTLRSEAPILLPLALALFAVLAGVTLAFYRASVGRFADDRTSEALTLAQRVLEEEPRPSPSRLGALRPAVPVGVGLALVDRHGRTLASTGGMDDTLPPPLVVEALANGWASAGPGELGGSGRIVALVRLSEPDEAVALRLDLPAAGIAAEQRTLTYLTPLVAGLTLATALVVILFFRALLRPYEAILERARAAAGSDHPVPSDEVEFLLSTFDRALAQLGTPDGDLAPLAGALGHSLDGGFLLLDPDRRVLVTTPAAAELLGNVSPPAGTPLAEALPVAPAAAYELDTALSDSGASTFQSLRLAVDGSERVLGCAAEPLRGEGGRLRGWLVVLADRTESERSAARERLAEGLAQLGELSAGVAHELRNGLAALDGWLELARRRPQAGAVADCLDEMKRESSQLARVVEEFLAFARPGTRRLEPSDLREIVRRAAADPVFSPPGVRLRLPAAIAELLGDPVLLERAIRNLIANAVEAQRAVELDEPVSIALEGDRALWRISIEDRGSGVPETLRDRLFEPFVSGRAGGVGLGLAFARRVALLHRGELRFTPRTDTGSRFELELPRSANSTLDT